MDRDPSPPSDVAAVSDVPRWRAWLVVAAGRWRAAVLILLATSAAIALVYLVLEPLPEWLVVESGLKPDEREKALSDARTNLMQLLGALGLIGGLVFTARSTS